MELKMVDFEIRFLVDFAKSMTLIKNTITLLCAEVEL